MQTKDVECEVLAMSAPVQVRARWSICLGRGAIVEMRFVDRCGAAESLHYQQQPERKQRFHRSVRIVRMAIASKILVRGAVEMIWHERNIFRVG